MDGFGRGQYDGGQYDGGRPMNDSRDFDSGGGRGYQGSGRDQVDSEYDDGGMGTGSGKGKGKGKGKSNQVKAFLRTTLGYADRHENPHLSNFYLIIRVLAIILSIPLPILAGMFTEYLMGVPKPMPNKTIIIVTLILWSITTVYTCAGLVLLLTRDNNNIRPLLLLIGDLVALGIHVLLAVYLAPSMPRTKCHKDGWSDARNDTQPYAVTFYNDTQALGNWATTSAVSCEQAHAANGLNFVVIVLYGILCVTIFTIWITRYVREYGLFGKFKTGNSGRGSRKKDREGHPL